MSNYSEVLALSDFRNSLGRVPSVGRARTSYNVMAIFDEFSAQCFASEAKIWRCVPQNAVLDLNYIKPDILLVESAWNGNAGAWKYMVTSTTGPRPPLIRLVSEARRMGVPTVFWNKEDPPHFDDFVETAKLFDYILTSDSRMIPRYEKHCPHATVGTMRFAASANLHNPAWIPRYREGDIAFAGQYFVHKYPERREQMRLLFSSAAKYKFSIFSRDLGGDERYQFPPEYDEFIVGSLPYEAMVQEYRRHKIFLNVNSVVGSRSMCARRVFELSAAKTVTLGTSSEAIRSVFSQEEVPLVTTLAEADEMLSEIMSDDWKRRAYAQNAWRKTMAAHTYRHRFEQIVRMIFGKKRSKNVAVHMVILANEGTNDARRLLENAMSQQFTEAGDCRITVSYADRLTDVLGGQLRDTSAVIDSLAQTPKVDYLGVMSPGYEYGAHYVEDLIMTAEQQASDVVSKVPSDDIRVIEESEERRSDKVRLSGWIASRDIFDRAVEWIYRHLSGEAEIELDRKICYVADPFELHEFSD